jgi:hypothetical protein
MDEVASLLSEILRWFEERNKPTEHRAYHACPVCFASWRGSGIFSREHHHHDCWVPELQEMVKRFEKMR